MSVLMGPRDRIMKEIVLIGLIISMKIEIVCSPEEAEEDSEATSVEGTFKIEEVETLLLMTIAKILGLREIMINLVNAMDFKEIYLKNLRSLNIQHSNRTIFSPAENQWNFLAIKPK
jgi:hypothetical protein